MAKVLYLTANPKLVEYSSSLSAGKVFIEAYKEANSEDVITEVDLISYEYPDVDYTVMSAFGKLQNGMTFEQLSTEEKQSLGRRQEVLEQFLESDKIIYVTPMWDLSYPAALKKYIDVIVSVGVTFKYSATGPVGLLADANKKVLHIQATGGDYGMGGNFGNDHLEAITKFIGISDYTHIPLYSQSIPGIAEQEREVAENILLNLAKTW